MLSATTPTKCRITYRYDGVPPFPGSGCLSCHGVSAILTGLHSRPTPTGKHLRPSKVVPSNLLSVESTVHGYCPQPTCCTQQQWTHRSSASRQGKARDTDSEHRSISGPRAILGAQARSLIRPPHSLRTASARPLQRAGARNACTRPYRSASRSWLLACLVSLACMCYRGMQDASNAIRRGGPDAWSHASVYMYMYTR